MTQPLVRKALQRSLDDAGAHDAFQRGVAVLDCYDAWAATIDDFAPVKVNCEVRALVPDPDEPERGLLAHDGSAVVYPCLIDLLAIDAADEYWVVSHQIVDEWRELEALVRDEEAVAACWAVEQDYLGLTVAGTIHNELRIGGSLDFPPTGATATSTRKAVAQHEGSGGGRSLPQHQRVSARASRAGAASRTAQYGAGILRRTRIRRTRHEITTVGALIAAEVAAMTRWPPIYPTPAAHCRDCEFRAPCLALTEGADPEPVLAANFRVAPAERPKPRLGQSTWGFGRGAAPPRW